MVKGMPAFQLMLQSRAAFNHKCPISGVDGRFFELMEGFLEYCAEVQRSKDLEAQRSIKPSSVPLDVRVTHYRP